MRQKTFGFQSIYKWNIGLISVKGPSYKINESRYIALSVVNILSIFFSLDFAAWKSVGLFHIAYIVTH